LPVVEIPEDSLVGLRADEDRLGEGVAERDIESFEESFAQDPPGHPTKSHATHPTNDPPGNKTRDFVGTPPRAPAPQPPMADEEPMPELPAVRSSPGDTVPELPALRPSPVDAVSDLPAVRSSAGGTVSELPTLQPSAGDPASEIPPPTITAGAKPIVEWPPEEQRTVVALRLVARPPERFRGNLVRQALAAEGFVLGELNIFHKPDAENHAVLSAASLTKPGTFDLETMDTQRFVGLNLFAVLPGPKSPQKAFDDLLTTARMLNERLEGALQDDRGGPLTPMRIQALRDALVSEAKL
jgi:FtsZ-interacting cell division protein ZipA